MKYCILSDWRERDTVLIKIPQKQTDGLYVAKMKNTSNNVETFAMKTIDEDKSSLKLWQRVIGHAN